MNIQSLSFTLIIITIFSKFLDTECRKGRILKEEDDLDENTIIGRPSKKGDSDEQDEDGQPRIKTQKTICGDSYFIQDNGYMRIRLFKEEECQISFLGSRASGCSVEIYCTDLETNNTKYNTQPCSRQFLEISDGLGGKIRECGKYSMAQPYKALYEGKDIYIKFKGMKRKGSCQIYCAEDRKAYVKEGISKLEPEALPKASEDVDSKYVEESCVCGKKSKMKGRIVGGETAVPFEYPWLAPVVFSKSGHGVTNRSSFCAASLITDRHMLTAAHCFYNTRLMPSDVNVLLHVHLLDLLTERVDPAQREEKLKGLPGLNLASVTDEDEATVRLSLDHIKVHPMYNPYTFDFDIAIIYLTQRINLKDPTPTSIIPVCLPPEDQHMDFENKDVEVAGWGKVDENGIAGARLLQKLTIPIIPWKQCDKIAEDLSPRHICGYVPEGGKDSCQGDSGGPVIYKFNEKQYMQAAIVSSGIGCARPGFPGLYTNIPEVIQWIYYNTRRSRWCKNEE